MPGDMCQCHIEPRREKLTSSIHCQLLVDDGDEWSKNATKLLNHMPARSVRTAADFDHLKPKLMTILAYVNQWIDIDACFNLLPLSTQDMTCRDYEILEKVLQKSRLGPTKRSSSELADTSSSVDGEDDLSENGGDDDDDDIEEDDDDDNDLSNLSNIRASIMSVGHCGMERVAPVRILDGDVQGQTHLPTRVIRYKDDADNDNNEDDESQRREVHFRNSVAVDVRGLTKTRCVIKLISSGFHVTGTKDIQVARAACEHVLSVLRNLHEACVAYQATSEVTGALHDRIAGVTDPSEREALLGLARTRRIFRPETMTRRESQLKTAMKKAMKKSAMEYKRGRITAEECERRTQDSTNEFLQRMFDFEGEDVIPSRCANLKQIQPVMANFIYKMPALEGQSKISLMRRVYDMCQQHDIRLIFDQRLAVKNTVTVYIPCHDIAYKENRKLPTDDGQSTIEIMEKHEGFHTFNLNLSTSCSITQISPEKDSAKRAFSLLLQAVSATD